MLNFGASKPRVKRGPGPPGPPGSAPGFLPDLITPYIPVICNKYLFLKTVRTELQVESDGFEFLKISIMEM